MTLIVVSETKSVARIRKMESRRCEEEPAKGVGAVLALLKARNDFEVRRLAHTTGAGRRWKRPERSMG